LRLLDKRIKNLSLEGFELIYNHIEIFRFRLKWELVKIYTSLYVFLDFRHGIFDR